MTITKQHIQQALELSKKHHSGQKDRAGKPYMSHILRVFKGVGGYNAHPIELGVVALLHDIVEDTSVNINQIYTLFGKVVGDAVKAITKTNSSYQSYLSGVKSNPIARVVKIVDMIDNSDISRIPNPTQLDMERVEKYKKGIKYLS